MPPAENLSKPSVVRRIPTVKGQTSVWRDCCPCGRERLRGAAPAAARSGPEPGSGPARDPARRPARRPVRALPEAPFARGVDTVGRVLYVLLVCGRAPGRALSYGRFGSASMVAAWVGPLHWTQWAGGHCRLIPRRRRTGPGGERHLPDCASTAVRSRVRGLCRGCPPPRWRSPAADGGFQEGCGKIRGMKWGEKGLLMRRVPCRRVAVCSENG